MGDFGKLLVLLGIFLTVLGTLTIVLPKLNIPLGNLPGDIKVEKGNFTLYFPIVSSLLISLVLTVIINLLISIFGKH
ncbi:MAG TPA: DUF2905 domain-containing protein [Aquificales bacterium]|uniref:DUF2905 domain-containing protein n=1 Tax=Aquifex aeolicus TaxID=63363 RepID=A0A9D0YQJ5_AQUAO|nr:DUF2905 domain-containing protein [Aquificales bacterium]HIP86275.1 DUF2905 domain-containing protein [Aquifex sp.]HIP98698.1 DUF2905 domain-containing protein [Aquifex aeolicus]